MSNRQESFPREAKSPAVAANKILFLNKKLFNSFWDSHECALFKFFIFYLGFLYEPIKSYRSNIESWRLKWNSAAFNKIPFFIITVSLIEVCLYYLTDDKLKRILLYDLKNNKEIWRFLTYMLIHKNEIHLFLNLIIQGFVGFIIEFEQGHFKFLVIYFGGGLAGSLGTSLFSSSKLMAGASGGIYSLLTSHIPNIILNYETIEHLSYRSFAVVVLILSDAIHISYHVLFRGNESPIIGWEAHVSGALAGFLLGFLIFKGTLKKKKKIQEFYTNILHRLLR